MSIVTDIDVVKFLLKSFRLFPNEEARQKVINDKAASNEDVYIYANFEEKLQDLLIDVMKKSTGHSDCC